MCIVWDALVCPYQSADHPGLQSNVEEGDDQGACRHHPIVRGSVVDFDHFEKLVEAAFENELRVNPAQAGLPVRIQT